MANGVHLEKRKSRYLKHRQADTGEICMAMHINCFNHISDHKFKNLKILHCGDEKCQKLGGLEV